MSITINTKPGQRYIELGCGDNPHPSCQVHVDVRSGPNIDFTANLEEPLPIGDDDFDGCLARYVLEHLNWRKVRSFLKEVCRILKPTGKVCFITANTAAQFDWIKKNPNGWDDKDDFDSFSCILFGDQDYPENAHKNYLDPSIITKLMSEAGFTNILVHPAGARDTDMIIEATKPAAAVTNGKHVAATKDEVRTAIEPTAVQKYSRAELFDKHYFNGGGKVGGYKGIGYRDFEANVLIFREVLKRQPKSVFEIGAARGHVLRRIQDHGIRANGLEISRHCWLTRSCDGIICKDVCETPWPYKDGEFDLSISSSTFEHIPEEHLATVLGELKRVCKRHLHYIDFGSKEDGFDKTHQILKGQVWWEAQFKNQGIADFEIIDNQEIERAYFPQDVLRGDGKLKLNIASHCVMHHHGWQNLDIIDLSAFASQWRYNFNRIDARNGLPYGTAAVDLANSSHFLEHLPYDDGLKFLKECRRVLKPGAVLRLAVPDAGKLMGMYSKGDDLSCFNEVNDGCENAPSQAAKLYALLHEGHSAIYDQETLAELLKRAGFTPHPSSFRNCRSEQIKKETIDMFPELSLYMDASY
jgi:predicted SAM-dependent methyltransferase